MALVNKFHFRRTEILVDLPGNTSRSRWINICFLNKAHAITVVKPTVFSHRNPLQVPSGDGHAYGDAELFTSDVVGLARAQFTRIFRDAMLHGRWKRFRTELPSLFLGEEEEFGLSDAKAQGDAGRASGKSHGPSSGGSQ